MNLDGEKMHEQQVPAKNEVQTQKHGFSINNLLATQLNDEEDEEAETENSTGRDSSTSTDQPEDEDLFGSTRMLGPFNTLLAQHLTQSSAAVASLSGVGTSQSSSTNSSLQRPPNLPQFGSSAFPTNDEQKLQSTRSSRLDSSLVHPPTSSIGAQQPTRGPEWYNALNYMANRQLQFISGNPAEWDPRFTWLQSYMPKTQQQKRKGGQIRFTNEQTDALEHMFDNNKYLSNVQRRKLAKSLTLSERQVKTWFQNRRAKWRRVRKDGEEEDDLGPGLLNGTTSSTSMNEVADSPLNFRSAHRSNNPALQVASLFHSSNPNGAQVMTSTSNAAVLAAAAAALAQRGHSTELFGMFNGSCND